MAEKDVMAVLRHLDVDGYYDGMELLLMDEAHNVMTCIAAGSGNDPADPLIASGFWVPEDRGPFPDELRAELIEAAWARAGG